MSLARVEIYAISGALVAGVFVLWKAGKLVADVAGSAAGVAKGVVMGDNAITKNATDANGAPVTAYQGVPVLGTIGAGTNAVSGGYLASFGSWLGGSLYDWTHIDPVPTVATPAKGVGQGYNTDGTYDPINAGVFGYGA